MVKPNIQEQICETDEAIENYPEYQEQLELHKGLLEIRRMVERLAEESIYGDFDEDLVNNLQDMASSTRKPIISFLDPSKFESKTLLNISKKATRFFADRHIGGNLDKLLKALEIGEINTIDPLRSIIREDAQWFEENAERFETDPALLLLIFSSTIQTFLENLARSIKSSFYEQWWESNCPICGRRPVTARIGERKRHLSCVFCGAEYLTDEFLCVNCGNNDPYTLGFLTQEGQRGLQIDFCEKCKNYLKVIDEDKLIKKIPQSLEDILTQRLDITAYKAGFKRK